jgi:hypothetical protein
MATSSATHYFDCATLANFAAWAQFISNAFSSFGWTQGNDTGQVVWTATSAPISQVAVGANAVYTYDATSLTGPALRVGMSITVTGFSTGGNNVTATITALGGSGASSTFTVALTTQANETHAATGATTAISSVPSASTYVYEIWNSADALSSSCLITVKMEYGQQGSQGPSLLYTVSTGGTDGAGNLNTPKTARQDIGFYTSTHDNTTLRPCYASGNNGGFRMVLFDNGGTGFPDNYVCGGLFICRSVSTSGAATADYVFVQGVGGNGASPDAFQQVVFNSGTGGSTSQQTSSSARLFACSITGNPSGAQTGVYGSQTLVSPVFPFIGAMGNPTPDLFAGMQADFTDAATVSLSPYGTAHNYLVWQQNVSWLPAVSGAAIIWRYE